MVVKSSTSFGSGKGGNVTSAGCQVTLCDLIWNVSSRSGVAMLYCELLYPYWYIVLAGASVSLAEINNNRLHNGSSGVRVHFH